MKRFALVLAALALVTVASGEKVKVGFYFETLCSGCHSYFLQQIEPTMQKLGQYIDLDLVPYGNARSYKVGNQVKTYCQHGDAECYGNVVEACVLDLYPFDQAFKFVHCMTVNGYNPRSSSPQCASSTNLDWNKIRNCAEGERGTQLVLEMDQKTKSLNPPHKYVPWVVVNGTPTTDPLFSYICRHHLQNVPACQ